MAWQFCFLKQLATLRDLHKTCLFCEFDNRMTDQWSKVDLWTSIHLFHLPGECLCKEFSEGHGWKVWIEASSIQITQIVCITRRIVLAHILTMLILGEVEESARHRILRILGKSSFGLYKVLFNLLGRYLEIQSINHASPRIIFSKSAYRSRFDFLSRELLGNTINIVLAQNVPRCVNIFVQGSIVAYDACNKSADIT